MSPPRLERALRISEPPPLPNRTSSTPPPRPSCPPIATVPVVELPKYVRATAVADRARESMLAVLRGIGSGWSKREIAEWLSGPYASLTSFAADLDAPEDSATFRRLPRRGALDRLDDVLHAAKEEVLATLILASPPDSDVRFAQRAILSGHIIRTRDAKGRAGWAPVDASRMLLADRILSLASVDYLMRPADYLALLSVCGECHAVAFDAQVRVRGHCAKHRRPSK